MVDIKRDYAHRGLQVVVKLANIELTPEKPTYEGGTWHVEGQMVCTLQDFSVLHLLSTLLYGSVLRFIRHNVILLNGNRMNISVLLLYTTSPIPISLLADSPSDSSHHMTTQMI